MELREAWSALRHGWWLCLAGLAVGAVVALVTSSLATPLYTSHLQLFVSTPNTSSSAAEALQGSQFSEQRVASYAALIRGDELARDVIAELDLDATPQELARQVTASGVMSTVLIDVTVSDPSPSAAQAVAQAIGELFPVLVDRLEDSGTDAGSAVDVTVVQSAELPSAPSSPQTERNIALGALIGLVAGAAVAVGWLGRRRAATRPDQLELAAAAPVVGLVLRDRRLGTDPDSSGSVTSIEAFRRLAIDLMPLNGPARERGRLVVVTSAVPGQGRSTLALHLAFAFADTGRNVLLVDADLGQRTLTTASGIAEQAGLAEVLSGDVELDEALTSIADGRLAILPSGRPVDDQRLLLSPRMEGLARDLTRGRDVVVVDAAALFPTADALGLVSLADDVLLGVLDGRTSPDDLVRAKRALTQVDAPLTGIVVSGMRTGRRSGRTAAEAASPPRTVVTRPAHSARPEPTRMFSA